MFLIKPCPSCKRKIRFPIDKGKIKVNCICGYEFIADPDDPDIYRDSRFDLKGSEKSKRKIAERIKSFYRDLDINRIINRIYDLKYKFQNFRLLPASEQRRLIMSLVSLFILMLIIIYFFRIIFANETVGDHIL